MKAKTYRSIMDEAFACTTREEAAALVEREVERLVSEYHIPEQECRASLLISIGYFTGYYDPATADRINDLFNTQHPVWGRAHPTPEEAFAAGLKMGEIARAKQE